MDQDAKVEVFYLDPVVLAHNVLFDPSVWFIAFFWLRGLLDYKVTRPLSCWPVLICSFSPYKPFMTVTLQN
jgi:hypothetical protein